MEKENNVFFESSKEQVKALTLLLLGEDSDIKERKIADRVVGILYETELERFEVVDISSVKNETVEGKLNLLRENEKIGDCIVPSSLTENYPLEYSKDNVEKAPWVNMVHAWNKVLNEFNTLYAIQRGDVDESSIPMVLASISNVLYNFTTDSDGDRYIRSNEHFLNGRKYVETIKREAGTKGANAVRHVCFEEMKYILDVVKNSYKKNSLE
ncbi:MAG: hypothetical protein ACOX0X_00610 [Candidatus Dojkabacteria bacterium]